MYLHMHLEWPLVIGALFPALYANKHVNHFRLQRLKSAVLLNPWEVSRAKHTLTVSTISN